MDYPFTVEMQLVYDNVVMQVRRMRSELMSTEHVLLAMLDTNSLAKTILMQMGVSTIDLRRKLEGVCIRSSNENTEKRTKFYTSKLLERAYERAMIEVRKVKAMELNSAHLLLSILYKTDDPTTSILNQFGIDYISIIKKYMEIQGKSTNNKPSSGSLNNNFDDFDDDQQEKVRKPSRSQAKNSTPTLDSFGRDLTLLAKQGKLDPVIGRKVEIERVSQILSRRKKNNPILIGEPGVGKSAIAEGLALKIVNKEVSRMLFNKRIVSLDLGSLVANTKYRGQFEERMKALMTELETNKDVILFIDEMHTLVGAGASSGSLDAANMFKPALGRGEIQCIGATTLNEYRQHIEKDGALERRFQKVMVEPTSVEESIEILHQIKDKYEAHHNVIYTDEAIHACVNLTSRYITSRFLPDKAIDAMDEAGSRVHMNNLVVPKEVKDLEKEIEVLNQEKAHLLSSKEHEKWRLVNAKITDLQENLKLKLTDWEEQQASNKIEITEDQVNEVVSMMSGIPVHRVASAEMEKLYAMSEILQEKVIGQQDAVKKVVKAIQRNRIGLKDPNRPIGTFVFLGTTGVGKTELAKVLSYELFDSEDSLIRIDMSEYMEKFSVSRLIGAPPGYVGYEEGGQLTEAIRRKPYSVVLLDEIEKAHPDVFNLLLQILDEGFVTDSLGRKVDFRNTILILTSNIGTREIKTFGEGVGFGTSAKSTSVDQNNRLTIEKALKKTFAPEFLNRIDDIVIFNSLEKEDVKKIIEIELKKLENRLTKMELSIELTDSAKDFLIEKSYDKDFGARPLKRALQKYVEDLLAELVMQKLINNGDSVSIKLNESADALVGNVQQKIMQE